MWPQEFAGNCAKHFKSVQREAACDKLPEVEAAIRCIFPLLHQLIEEAAIAKRRFSIQFFSSLPFNCKHCTTNVLLRTSFCLSSVGYLHPTLMSKLANFGRRSHYWCSELITWISVGFESSLNALLRSLLTSHPSTFLRLVFIPIRGKVALSEHAIHMGIYYLQKSAPSLILQHHVLQWTWEASRNPVKPI